MPRKENAEFLVSLLQPLPKFPTHVFEAMLTWLFGSDERTIRLCAYVAYTALKKAPLAVVGKMPEQEKLAWREDVALLISRCLDELFSQDVSEREAFDAWHKETCEKIRELSNEHDIPKWATWMENGFTYASAQKWLNTTIKNMLVMERWDEHLQPLKKYLHVPVDSYVMEAASEDLEIPVPCKSGGLGKYSLTGSKADSKPWSRWEYSDYIGFQEELRKAVDCPIDWEFSAWNNTEAKRGNH